MTCEYSAQGNPEKRRRKTCWPRCRRFPLGTSERHNAHPRRSRYQQENQRASAEAERILKREAPDDEIRRQLQEAIDNGRESQKGASAFAQAEGGREAILNLA